jgi:transcriptional regulator
MYVPPAFAEDDPEELQAIMRQCPLPVLVSALKDGPAPRLAATHLPMLYDGKNLIGHIAKANEQWKLLDPTVESLAIFKAVDGYVSPSFYATKQETGKVVPTWNYEAVHAYGTLEIIEDSEKLLGIVSRLTNHHEQPRAKPWQVSDAPPDYIATQLKGIVGIILHVSKLFGARKLSQNKIPADRDGVIAGQQQENTKLAHQMILASKGGK